MEARVVFSYLAAGLLDTLSCTSAHPFRDVQSPLLGIGRDMLLGLFVDQRRSDFPLTDADWIALFEQPLHTWWPGLLPDGVDGNHLMWLDGYPADWLAEYLADCNVRPPDRHGSTAAWYFQSDLDQAEIQQLINWCRARGEDGEHVYSAVRKYLVRHPVTTKKQLKQSLLDRYPLLDSAIIFGFYETPSPLHLHQGTYWTCPYCQGMLRWYQDRPRCVRHSICDRMYPNYRERKRISSKDDLLVLKLGIHWRVCITGIPELRLHEWLDALCRQGKLRMVALWPGVDRYDLRIEFNDGEAWAVDVKDYGDPRHLRDHIETQGRIYRLPPLTWQKSYYVIPDYRAKTPHYLNVARPEAYRRYVNGIVGIGRFKQYVNKRIVE